MSKYHHVFLIVRPVSYFQKDRSLSSTILLQTHAVKKAM